MVTEVPLSNTSGGVAKRFEMICQSVFGGIQAVIGCGEKHVFVQSDALRVAPGEQSSTGRRADGAGHHEAGEPATFLRQAVEVGRLDRFRSEATKVVVSLIIGEDDDEIRLRCEALWRERK